MVHTMPKAKSELLASDTRIETLIERVETATGPDREIDARVWCEVLGYEFSAMKNEHSFKYAPYPSGLRASLLWGHQLTREEHYTASFDAVVALVKRALPGWIISLNDPSPHADDGWYASLWCREKAPIQEQPDPERWDIRGNGTTPALALLTVFLRALLSSFGTVRGAKW